MGRTFIKLLKIVKEGKPDVLQSMGLERVEHNLEPKQQQSFKEKLLLISPLPSHWRPSIFSVSGYYRQNVLNTDILLNLSY